MKKDLTEIVFILDRSGSMENLVKDTLGGFNSFVENQKKEAGEAVLTTVLFDNEYSILHNGENIQNINALTTKEYYSRGSTALLDAIGKTINDVENRILNAKKKNKPSKVIFVITTDGYENSSKEFTNTNIKNMIEKKTNDGWEFMFLGANVDSFSMATTLGISAMNTSNYTADSFGTQSIYSSLTNTVKEYRTSGIISQDWAKDIQ